MGPDHQTTLRFDDFTLELQPATLRRNGKVVPLQSQPLRLLTLLISHQGEIVSHEEISKCLWGDLPIDYSSRMHVGIGQIRRALSDDGENPRFIETVPRKGYRFVADVIRSPIKNGLLVRISNARSFVLAGTLLLTMLVVGVGLSLRVFSERPLATGGDISTTSADDAYVRGRELLNSGHELEAERARSYFERAIKADPGFAPSYAGMARAYEITRNFEDARIYAQTAILKDSTYAEAYLRLAAVESYGSWNWPAAEDDIERALALTYDAANVHYALAANYIVTGRSEKGFGEMEIAISQDPASAELLAEYGRFLYYNRRFDKARVQCAAAVVLESNHLPAQLCLYQVELAGKNYEKTVQHAVVLMGIWGAQPSDIATVTSLPFRRAIEEFEIWRIDQLRIRAESETVSPLHYAFSLAVLKKYDEALYYLIQGHDDRFAMTPFALLDPIFVPIRHQTRFLKLAEDMGVEFPAGS